MQLVSYDVTYFSYLERRLKRHAELYYWLLRVLRSEASTTMTPNNDPRDSVIAHHRFFRTQSPKVMAAESVPKIKLVSS
jgi:hypothetical protein